MNRKVLVAAVAAAFAAPAAFAQSSVTVGGTVNIMWDHVKASGATAGSGADMRSHDRVRDGAGSNIRFTVIEDLGGGTSAFVQVESAVVNNSDTRGDLVGNAGAAANTAIWGNRNTAVGIRSKAAGRFLIGVWDVHYHEHYAIDPAWIPGNSAWSTLGLTNNMGSGLSVNPVFGGRLSNVIKWDSPNWSGFSMTASYARPSDGVPNNTAGDVRQGKRNRNWSISPRFERGGLSVVYSYMQDKDAVTNATMSFAGVNVGNAVTVFTPTGAAANTATVTTGTVSAAWKITSNRLGVRYKFPFGLGIGALWDVGKVSNTTNVVGAQVSIKRTVWAFPISYDTGNHHVMATFARARDWKGTFLGMTDLDDTSARLFSIGYMYNLSQRTNVSVGYVRIRNDEAVRYDMFANSSGNTAIGADPRSISFGLRHTF